MRSIAALLVVAACGSFPQNTGPGEVIGPGVCAVAPYTGSLTAAPECVLSADANPDQPCECTDYAGTYPAGVYDSTITAVAQMPEAYPNAEFDEEGRMKGCCGIIRYAMPDCTTLAEVSGHVATDPELSIDSGSDDDLSFNICPLEETMRRHPFDASGQSELRGYGSFEEDGIRGRMHIEVQGCRYYQGSYSITEPGAPRVVLNARPTRTDLVSAAGDWIWDANYFEQGGGWSEIHEARAIAVTRQISPVVSYSFLSGFFSDNSLQSASLSLDVKVPAPLLDPQTYSFLDCYVPDNLPNERANPKVPGQVISASMDPIVTGLASNFPGGCRTKGIFIPPIPDAARGVCQFNVARNSTSPVHDFNCQGACDHKDNGGDCSGIAAAMAIRAEWLDPGDTWVCNNCACADPSSPGASIAAPVQGCAQAGLDPQDPTAQAVACSQVCGGVVCGEAPGCRIDTCAAPAQATAELIGRSTCDPLLPIPLGRVAPVGDYHAVIDPGLSNVKIIVGSHSTTQSAAGEFYFNRSGQVLDFASSLINVAPFEFKDRSITEARVFTVQRMFGQMSTGNSFFIPAGIGAFGARALVDDKPRGINATNPQPLFGEFDIANRHFVLDVAATNPEETDQKLVAHFEGTIDNLPPVASPGPTERTVECTSQATTAVPLSAAASADPDVNDSITHYQWFNATTGSGLGNTAMIMVNIPLGLFQFVLHVYDRKLGSDSTPFSVRVVDTTPPVLSVQPQDMCMWPPNHRRIRLGLGQDLQVSVQDVCDANPQVKIVSVTSNEPDNFTGDGDTTGDIAFSDHAACLRRERSGTGTGRTYTAVVQASDASGNTSQQTVTVRVPKRSERGCGAAGVEIPEGAVCN